MAHFAKLNADNIVEQVIVVNNSVAPDEKTGQAHLASCGFAGVWKMTSYNTYGGVHNAGGTPFRGNYAGVGMIYDETHDAFITAQPDPSWILNAKTFLWEAPETLSK